MAERYTVVDGSQSAHCCFDATVVDTMRPLMIGGKHWNNQFEEVCECFDRADADRIAAALNAADGVEGRDRPLGCALAMRVMQSDLYKQLDDAERADCDELVRQGLEWFKQDASGVPGLDGGQGNG